MTQDTILLDRYVADGDRAALEELFARHYPAVRRSILHMVHDGFDADDLAQATFLKAVRKSASYTGAGSFRGWLLAIAVNEVRDFRRGKKRRREDALFDLYQSTDPAADVPATGIRREFEQKLEQALEGLSPELKDPLVLHYYEGLSFSEVAELLGVPKSTAATRVGSAVKRLKRAFAQRGWVALLPTFDRVLEPIGNAADTVAAGTGASASGSSKAIGDWLTRLRHWFDNSRLSGSVGVVAAMAVVIATVLGLGFAEWFGGEPVPSDGGDRVAARSDGATAAPAAGARAAEVARAEATGVDRIAMVQGRVIDALTGHAVAGAAVVLHDYRQGEDLHTASDDAGLFAFPETAGRSDAFALAVATPYRARRLHASVQTSVEPRRYVVRAARQVTGRVIDADGVPVRGCRVVAMRRPRLDPVLPLAGAIPRALRVDASVEVADGSGDFVLSGLAPTPVDLVVEVPGESPWIYEREDGLLPGEPEAMDLTLKLPKAVDVRVHVRDRETGEPITNAFLFGRRLIHDWRERLAIPVRAGEQPGSYVLRRWSTQTQQLVLAQDPGREFVDDTEPDMDILVGAPGYGAVDTSYEAAAWGNDYVYELTRAGAIQGRVLDDQGAAMVHARVLVNGEEGLDEMLVTDDDGRFELTDLASGSEIQLAVVTPDHVERPTMTQVVLLPGETRRVTLGGRGPRGMMGAVAGRMTAFGAPARAICVRVERAGADGSVITYTDRNGEFRIDGLVAGTWEVQFWPDRVSGPIGPAPRGSRVLEIGPGQQVRLDVNVQHAIAGRVLAVPDRHAAGEIPLRVRHVATGATFGTVAAPDGRFAVFVPDAGTYRFELDWTADWLPHHMPGVTVPGAGGPTDVEILVAKDLQDGVFEFAVVDAVSGEPVVAGQWQTMANGFNGVGRLVAAGNDVRGLSVGSYRIRVHTDDYVATTFEFAIDAMNRRPAHRFELVRATRLEFVGAAATEPHPAGLLPGDRIVRWGDHVVRSFGDLKRAHAAIGDVAAPLCVRRGGVEVVLSVKGRQLPVLEGTSPFTYDFDGRLQNR